MALTTSSDSWALIELLAVGFYPTALPSGSGIKLRVTPTFEGLVLDKQTAAMIRTHKQALLEILNELDEQDSQTLIKQYAEYEGLEFDELLQEYQERIDLMCVNPLDPNIKDDFHAPSQQEQLKALSCIFSNVFPSEYAPEPSLYGNDKPPLQEVIDIDAWVAGLKKHL